MVAVRKLADGAASWSARVAITKVDKARQEAFGWASVVIKDGQVVIDHDSDVIPVEEIEAAAYSFVKAGGPAGEMHERIGVGHLIESVVLTTEKRKSMGVPDGDVGWWVGFKVTDSKVWKRVYSGELPEFSIGGSARRVPMGAGEVHKLVELDVEEVSFVDAGAGRGVQVALVKSQRRGRVASGVTMNVKQFLAKVLKHTKDAGQAADIAIAISKAEVTTLADVQAALDEELWAVVLQAIEAASMGASPAAAEAKAEDEPPAMPPEEETAKTEGEDEEIGKLKKRAEEAERKAKAHDAEIRKMAKALEEERRHRRVEKTRSFVAKNLAAVPESEENLASAWIALEDIEAANGGPVEIPPAVAKSLKGLLEKVHKAISQSALLKSFGTTGAEEDEASPLGKIRKAAKELQSADPKLTKAKAFVKACEANPALYAEYKEELHGRSS